MLAVWLLIAVRTGPQLIEKLKQGITIDSLKTLTPIDNSLVLRTPMGVPLSLNLTAGAVVKVQGVVKANSLPDISHFLLRRPFMTKKIEIVSDIKPRYRAALPNIGGSRTPLFQSKANETLRLPASEPNEEILAFFSLFTYVTKVATYAERSNFATLF